MKRALKTNLLVSTALLLWAEGAQPIYAMQQVDLTKLSATTTPSHALGSQTSFFGYLDTLKNGSNDSLIEGAKEAYSTEAKSHPFKLKAAFAYLQTTGTAKELSKEEREQRQRTEQKHKEVSEELVKSKQQIQKVEEEKGIVQEALGQVQGFTKPEEIQEFLKNFKEAMSGFSDGLFLLKFKGDEEPEFEKTLTKIAEQAKASAAMKKGYEEDKRIKKLDIFLQLPSHPIDLDSINHNFQKEQEVLLNNVTKKISEFVDLVKKVKSNFERISEKPEPKAITNALGATPDDIEYFEKYWLTEEKVENEAYVRIFQSAGDLINFYNELIGLLKKKYKKPTEFKKEYDLLLKKNEGILSEDFSGMIGGEALNGKLPLSEVPKTDGPQFLLLNISGLSLYHYLRLRKDHVSEKLEQYMTKLMDDVKKMRVDAYQLKGQIGKPQEVFMKFDEGDPDLKLEPKIMGEFLGYIDRFEKGMGENTLQRNIQNFLSQSSHGYTDFNKMKEYKEENSELENTVLGAMKKLTLSWEKSFKSKDGFYNSKTLRGLFSSDLYVNAQKDKLVENISQAISDRIKKSSEIAVYDKYLSNLVKTKFQGLEVNAKKIDFKLLFDEPLSVKEARKKRNELKEEANRKIKDEKEKIPLEVAPPITLESSNLGTLIRFFINNSNNPTFENFWRGELHNNESDIAKFMKALSKPQSRDEVEKIAQEAFAFLKDNTEEQKQLYRLFDRVIEAKKHHDEFMKKMHLVKVAFEPLKSGPKHAKLEIQKKVTQLAALLAEKSDVYLKMEHDVRAVNYAYNFPMFYVEELKPLDKDDKKMKIWGAADDTAFDGALKEAYEAYEKARDAIRAINPTATEDSIGAVRLGGFNEGEYQIHQLAQSFDIIPTMQQFQPPPLRGDMQPPTAQRGGAPLRGDMQPPTAQRGAGLRGGPIGVQQGIPVPKIPEEEQIKLLCNECHVTITKVVFGQGPDIESKFSTLFELIYKKYIETASGEALQRERRSEIEARRDEKKHSIVESVTKKLTEEVLNEVISNLIVAFEYEYIDKDRPDMSTILDTIKVSCKPETIKQIFNKIFEGEIASLKGKEEKNALAFGGRKEKKEVSGETKQAKHKLLSLGQKDKDEEKGVTNPFGKLRKVVKIEDNQKLLSKTAQAESELSKIEPADDSQVLKKQADEQRLAKIKEFLEGEKGAEFAKGFADAELLAFPLWAILDLVPVDLEQLHEGFEVDNLPNRKFSPKVLEVIKGVRFNKHEQERVKSELLTADAVKKETPKQLLGPILEISQSILTKLISNGDIK